MKTIDNRLTPLKDGSQRRLATIPVAPFPDSCTSDSLDKLPANTTSRLHPPSEVDNSPSFNHSDTTMQEQLNQKHVHVSQCTTPGQSACEATFASEMCSPGNNATPKRSSQDHGTFQSLSSIGSKAGQENATDSKSSQPASQKPTEPSVAGGDGCDVSPTTDTAQDKQKTVNILVPRKKQVVQSKPQSVKRKHTDNTSDKVKLSKTTSKATSRRAHPSPPLDDTPVGRPPNVDKVLYGRYKMGAWYYSPYPAEFGEYIKELYICEHCLKYVKDDGVLRAHRLACRRRKPPGRVIYENENIKVYEIDGREHKLYCQNLCLMSKLFLDHKTLYYDVEGFMFYALTEKERSMDITVGYFSKEKVSYDNYNLACIMVLPTHQRKGYGRLLIELSYELSKHESVIGSPEKPLSSLGMKGYRSYWAATLIPALREHKGQFSIQDLSKATGIHTDDVISTLSWLGLLKFWKKELLPPPNTGVSNAESDKPSDERGRVQICMTEDMLESAIQKYHIRLDRMIDPTKIIWN